MKNELNKNDPIKRQAEVSTSERGNELSPMSPPDAYNPPSDVKVEYELLHLGLKHLVDEHNQLKEKMVSFELALMKLQKNSALMSELNKEFLNFFENFHHDFSSHNKKEEKFLFPILAKRFLEVGEHSKARNPITPIDILEDEHIEATKLANEACYIWTLVFKISDYATIRLMLKDFLLKSLRLIELVRLHIFREDNIVFSLAQKHLAEEELNLISYRLVGLRS